MEYNGYLLSGDTPVAEIKQGRVIPLDKTRMPLFLAAGGQLEYWLVSRAIDHRRPNARILKKVLLLSDASDLAAVLRVHGAKVTDDYWVRAESESSLSWRDVAFSEDTFAEIALTGSFSSYNRTYKGAQFASSPELTNIGSYEKCWRIQEGSWQLYKSGAPLERFSELFIARLGARLGFPMVEYWPDSGSVWSADFTEGIYNFEPASAIVGDEEDYAYDYDRLTALEPSLGAQYLDILYMDALCFNMDRHMENYGVLRDRSTGRIVRMAPNFDNNIALISRGYPSEARHTNGLLIDLFVELLEEKGLSYHPPVLDGAVVREVAESTLPEEEIDRDYVVEMVLERGQRIRQRLEQIENINLNLKLL